MQEPLQIYIPIWLLGFCKCLIPQQLQLGKAVLEGVCVCVCGGGALMRGK